MKVLASIWFVFSAWIISKHFKLFITINGIIGEKTIDLSYPIWNFDSSKEVAVIMSMFSDNVEYEMKRPLGLKLMNGSEKQALKRLIHAEK